MKALWRIRSRRFKRVSESLALVAIKFTKERIKTASLLTTRPFHEIFRWCHQSWWVRTRL